MKQLLQNMKNGELMLAEVPSPTVDEQTVLVHNHCSLISLGTEKTKLELGRKSLLQKARARPDQVKKVIQKIKTEGLLQTCQKVNERLTTPSPLGYSCAGVAIEVGSQVKGIQSGDRVACAGAGYANHAEMVAVPQNLCAPIPPTVDTEEAAFTTVGAIALQGLRLAEPKVGEVFAVIGLGLIGQITVQLLQANGCQVLATDLEPAKRQLAHDLGAIVTEPGHLKRQSDHVSGHQGVDGVLICASTSSNEPIKQAGEITRERGRVVAVGAVGLNMPREPYYQKEIQFAVARSYGPGRYDPAYEERGIDYPYGYVRFTENRNMQAFLQLLAQHHLDMEALITQRYAFDDALQAYETLDKQTNDALYLGIVLEYSQQLPALRQPIRFSPVKTQPHVGQIRMAMAGGGHYATGVLLPLFKRMNSVYLSKVMTARGYSAYHIAKKHQIHEAVGAVDELLGSTIDLLTVVTQHHQHGPLTLKGLQAGKHVYTEKPLALTLPQLKAIYHQWMQDKSRVLWVGFNRRFAPLTERLQAFFNGLDQPKVIDIQANAGTVDGTHWIQDPDIGGGRIIGEACHFVDLASCLAGSHPVSVYCRGLPSEHQSAQLNDNALINLAFADGSIANITYTASGNTGMPKERVTVYCGGRSAFLEDFKTLWLYPESGKVKKQRGRGQDKGQQAMLEALVTSIKQGSTQLPADAVFLSTLATLKAVQSMASGMSLPVGWQDLQSEEAEVGV